MKNNQMEYKGYLGSVEWSEPDKVFYGKILNIRGLFLYEGNTIDELRKEFYEYVDAYLDDCKNRGIKPQKPYSGSFNVRVDSKLHQIAVEKAQERGISLNKLVNNALTAYLL